MNDRTDTDKIISKSYAGLSTTDRTAEITGVSTTTLKAWEHQHSIVNPVHTIKGQRLYSNSDIARIKRAKILVDQGVDLSQVTKILAQELGGLLDVIPLANRDDISEWQDHREQVLSCLENRRIDKLANLHQQLFDNYSSTELHDMLCNSILEELKARGDKYPELADTYYSYLSYLSCFLGHRVLTAHYPEENPKILVFNRSEAYHTQLRCLWYILVLVDCGFNTGLLDQNPPLEAVINSAKRFDYKAVVVIRHPSSNVSDIQENLAPLLPVFMVGEHYDIDESAENKITLLPRNIRENIAVLSKHVK